MNDACASCEFNALISVKAPGPGTTTPEGRASPDKPQLMQLWIGAIGSIIAVFWDPSETSSRKGPRKDHYAALERRDAAVRLKKVSLRKTIRGSKLGIIPNLSQIRGKPDDQDS
jgi:hypothetical protein